jgi:hypothetical protein
MTTASNLVSVDSVIVEDGAPVVIDMTFSPFMVVA